MTKLAQDFTIVAGESAVLEITVTEGGAAKDLTGATIVWRLSADIDHRSNVLQKDTTESPSGINITNAAGGIFQVLLTASETTGLAIRDHLHQAIVTFTNSDVAVVTEGKATVKGQIVAT